MVLTFTGSLSVAEAGRDDVRTMLIGALGCNLAWGIIDGMLLPHGRLTEKGRALRPTCAVRGATDPAEGPPADRRGPAAAGRVSPRAGGAGRDAPAPSAAPRPARTSARWTSDDWLGALGVFLLVFLSTFPVAIPFMVMKEAVPAMRVSNAIAITLLFLSGYLFGKISKQRPWVMGISMVVVGSALVGMTIALGG